MSTPSITRVDFVPIPTQDAERATAFYTDMLGLVQSEHTHDKLFSEFDLGGTTLSVWDPSDRGPGVRGQHQRGGAATDDVAAMRKHLEGKGVSFFGPTVDTGVCHMAFFADLDGNPLMLHGRYAPRT